MANEPSAAQRKLFAKMGYAMPDGSFYIRPLPEGKSDLENAIRAVGRGEQGGTSGASIRQHIMKRAAALKLSSEIPDTWNSDGTLKEAAQSSMTLTDFFAHHGVKGMHWGVRKELETAGNKLKSGAKKAGGTALDHPFLTLFGARVATVLAKSIYNHRGEIATTAWMAGKVGAYLVKQAFAKDSPVEKNLAIGRQVVQGFVVHGIDGVSALKPSPQTVTNSSDHDRLLAAAQDHQDMAASHMNAAAKATQDASDLQRKGLNSSVAQKALGNNSATEPDWSFQRRNQQTKSQAVASLSDKLNKSRDSHVRLAIHHSKMAQKLKTKAESMAHDGLTFDPNFDIDTYLAHFGVKGMHWGVRKARGPASEDHEQATQIRGKIKDNGGIHALSNDELKTLNERLNLEANYSRLNPEEVNAGKKAATNILGNVANQQANKYANKAATAAIDHLISEAGKAHASRKRNAPLKVVSVR